MPVTPVVAEDGDVMLAMLVVVHKPDPGAGLFPLRVAVAIVVQT